METLLSLIANEFIRLKVGVFEEATGRCLEDK
jgi:hypothetical protein